MVPWSWTEEVRGGGEKGRKQSVEEETREWGGYQLVLRLRPPNIDKVTYMAICPATHTQTGAGVQ